MGTKGRKNIKKAQEAKGEEETERQREAKPLHTSLMVKGFGES
jgi:hypothetical protein